MLAHQLHQAMASQPDEQPEAADAGAWQSLLSIQEAQQLKEAQRAVSPIPCVCRQSVEAHQLDKAMASQPDEQPEAAEAGAWQSLLSVQEAQHLREAQRRQQAIFAAQEAKVSTIHAC